MASILLLNGPNLNLLGTREPDLYGRTTLADIEEQLRQLAQAAGHLLDAFQSNAEHALVDRIHQAGRDGVAYILINAGALTHTSIAIRDALKGVDIPFVEVHLSNVHARESFRHRSYLSDVAAGVIIGLGAQGYTFALQAAISHLDANR